MADIADVAQVQIDITTAAALSKKPFTAGNHHFIVTTAANRSRRLAGTQSPVVVYAFVVNKKPKKKVSIMFRLNRSFKELLSCQPWLINKEHLSFTQTGVKKCLINLKKNR